MILDYWEQSRIDELHSKKQLLRPNSCSVASCADTVPVAP